MTLTPEELERITVLTLAHYNRRADAFWEGTRDHDVSPEDMFDGTLSHRHRTRPPIQSALHGVEHTLMLPAGDASEVSRRALRLDRTLRARAAPVAANLQAALFPGVPVDGPLPGRAFVLIVAGDVDEVRLVESSFGLGVGGH